jgi:hypothetical protein
LKEIIEELQNFRELLINGIEYNIKYTLGGDLKWLAIVTGINAANSDQPCPWCKFNKKNNDDLKKSWSISDRSHEESEANQNSFGYKNQTLFKFIKFEEIVIDSLHLLLRITDVLFEKLLGFIEYLDSENRERTYFQRLGEILIGLKITSPFYISKKGKTKLRSLNKRERLLFLDSLRTNNFKAIFHEHANNNKLITINWIFLKFNELFNYSMNDFSENNYTFQYNENYLKPKLSEWLGFVLKLINYDNLKKNEKQKKKEKEHITPYIHAMVHHIPEFISTFKNLEAYCTQALEKSHNSTKVYVMRQTNKQKDKFVKQLLEKENRMEFYNLKGTTAELLEKINI